MNRKTIIWLTAVTFAAGTVQADQLLDDLQGCRDLTSAVARLDCYDAAVDRSRQSETSRTTATAAPAPAPEPTATAAAEISQEELFGKNSNEVQRTVEKVTGDERIDSLSAQVARLQQSGYNKVLITLDNGQLWQQTDTSSLRLKVGDDVRIDRASLGSFLLRKKGNKRTMRVSRRD